MAGERKFGALAGLRQQAPAKPADEAADTAAPPALPAKGTRGRPPGKRSNPEFEPTTVFLRKQTKRAATRRLEDLEAGQDLSDLLEQLLSDWVRQH